jgi:hypothetical protein
MFKMLDIAIRCDVPDVTEARRTARNIELDFHKHRPWHQSVVCRLEDGALILRARNDFDEDGSLLVEEFTSCLAEHMIKHGEIRILSISEAPLASSHSRFPASPGDPQGGAGP